MYTREHIVAFNTLVYFEVARFMSRWKRSLVPPTVNITLYFLVFGHFVGARLSAVSGFTFMQFIMPGLVIMAIVMATYGNAVSSFFGCRFNRSIEELLVAPVPCSIILLGFVTSSIVRGLLSGIFVILISMCFTRTAPHSVILVFLSAVLSSALFALLGFFNAIFVKRMEDVSIAQTFVIGPLIYLGGIFYTIDQLPPFWQKISIFNPLLYIVDTFRYGFLGVSSMNVVFGFSAIVVSVFVLFVLNLNLLRKGVGIRS